MAEKRGWYASVSRLLRWEKNREDKTELLFVGFMIGLFTSLVIFTSVTVLQWAIAGTLLINDVLTTTATMLGMWTLIGSMAMIMLTLYFGYRDLNSVIKKTFFKYGLSAGVIAMVLIIIIAFLQTF